MIPTRFASYLFGLLLSGTMSLLVSGISTFRATGMIKGFGMLWMNNWMFGWAVAFPTVLVVGPIVRRLVARVCASDPEA